ncbi:MAG: type III pantothenate kinase [Bacteroidota bacterium]
MNLLAIDIGNSDIVFGLHDGKKWLPQWRHPSSDYLSTLQTVTQRSRETGIQLQAVDQVIFSSVVPGISPFVLELVRQQTQKEPWVMGPELYLQADIHIDNPWEIGADLVANAVAGFTRVQSYCVIVDFGTALTFTVVDDTGHIMGVSIAPGLKTAMNSLSLNTAQLPQVPLEFPPSAMGKTTAHALQSGIMLGYVGLVKEILAHIKKDLGNHFQTLATGGLSRILTPLHGHFDHIDPNLTLEGLRIIADRVVKKAS